MNKKELFKQINELCCNLDNKYNINSGGCCYVAACIAEQLELKNIPFKIVHYNLYGCHYAIKVSDRYLNRANYKKKEIVEYLDWTSDQLFHHYYEDIWSSCYDPKHNTTVKISIKSVFSKYENCRT